MQLNAGQLLCMLDDVMQRSTQDAFSGIDHRVAAFHAGSDIFLIPSQVQPESIVRSHDGFGGKRMQTLVSNEMTQQGSQLTVDELGF